MCVFVCTGYQIEPFNNPADFFMDVTNGEAKSTLETLTAGTPTQNTYRHSLGNTNGGYKHGFRWFVGKNLFVKEIVLKSTGKFLDVLKCNTYIKEPHVEIKTMIRWQDSDKNSSRFFRSD